MTKLTLMAGTARAGKSTICKEVYKGIPIVNGDAIRLAIHGQTWLESAELLVQAHIDVQARAHAIYGAKAVVIDGTCNSQQRAEPWLARGFDSISIHTVFTSLEECIARASKTTKVSTEVLWAQHTDFMVFLNYLQDEYKCTRLTEGQLLFENYKG